MAVTIHQGSYETIDRAYAAMAEWIASNDLMVAYAPQEAYLTAPDDPAGPITEIRWPVQ
jgi:effector-binding domain-containing protein